MADLSSLYAAAAPGDPGLDAMRAGMAAQAPQPVPGRPTLWDAIAAQPGRIASGVADAVTLPRDVMQGRVDPMSDEGIGRAQGMAGLMAGGLPGAEEGAAGIFGGKLSQTADLGMLDEAKAARALQNTKWGSTPAQALQETGWFRGRDGEWRNEISDHDAAIKPGSEAGATLGDVLSHPDLYAAYPNLQSMPLDYYPGTQPTGSYSRLTDSVSLAGGMTDADRLNVLLHEAQHAVQSRESFAAGSNPSTLHGGQDAYRRTAGEVEARNVAQRRQMTPDQRVTDGQLPWQTMDVPADQQLTDPRRLFAPYTPPPVGHPDMGKTLVSGLPNLYGAPAAPQPTFDELLARGGAT